MFHPSSLSKYHHVFSCGRFYFTAACESLGVKEAKEPVGLLLDKVPSFLVRNSAVVCRFCSVGISSLEEMVQHWKEERGREVLVERRVEKVPHAEVVMVAREEKRVEEKQEERGGLEIQETEKREGEYIGGSTGEAKTARK